MHVASRLECAGRCLTDPKLQAEGSETSEPDVTTFDVWVFGLNVGENAMGEYREAGG